MLNFSNYFFYWFTRRQILIQIILSVIKVIFSVQYFFIIYSCNDFFLLESSDSNICPIDHEIIEIGDEVTYPDRAKEREILKLQCLCVNSPYGCQWIGTIKLLQVKHISDKFAYIFISLWLRWFLLSRFNKNVVFKKKCLSNKCLKWLSINSALNYYWSCWNFHQ